VGARVTACIGLLLLGLSVFAAGRLSAFSRPDGGCGVSCSLGSCSASGIGCDCWCDLRDEPHCECRF
jgi:hypothetical protein